MKRLICISKKTFYIALVLLLAGGAIFASKLLSETKTSYQSKASPPKSPPKIVGGGEVTKEGKWPFMVRIRKTLKNDTLHRWCAGTLVAPGWVYTAGHCVLDENGSLDNVASIIVKAGSISTDKMTEYSVFDPSDLKNSVFPHPQFKIYKGIDIYSLPDILNGRYYARYDVALIKLERVPEDSNKLPLQTISLSNNATIETEGQAAVILGWGQINPGKYIDGDFSSKLKEAIIPILDKSRDFKSALNTDSSEILGGFPKGDVNVCRGDSGGPLLVWDNTKWVLTGNTWYGVGECGASSYYTGFGRTLFFSDWITQIIRSQGLSTYNGIGTFKGSNLEQPQLEAYNLRLCETEVWSGSKPTLCTSVSRDEILVWKPIYNTTNKLVIDTFAQVVSVDRDIKLTPNVNFDSSNGDKAYLAKNTPYYVCMKHTSYSPKDNATIYWYARKEIVDNVSTKSVTPHPTSANNGTQIIPDFSAMRSTGDNTTDFELGWQIDSLFKRYEFSGYDPTIHGVGCKKISFTYMNDTDHPVVLGGDYYSFDRMKRTVVDPDGNKTTKDSRRFVAKPLEIRDLAEKN